MGKPSGARLRAKARTDWVRGLSLPLRLRGRPTTRPFTPCPATVTFSRSRSAEHLPRFISSAAVAIVQPASLSATPIVFVHTSSPISLPPPEIGRAHVWTPVTNAHLVCRLLLE